jgi:hypothetical protein
MPACNTQVALAAAVVAPSPHAPHAAVECALALDVVNRAPDEMRHRM